MFSCSEFKKQLAYTLIFTKFSSKTLKADISHECDNPFLETFVFLPVQRKTRLFVQLNVSPSLVFLHFTVCYT